ncbi:MAG TPA: ferritin-like domain-containing protein [Chthonomonadaceae bacterium]|nr:ferritin-like domain-containing protein [Chthonomonadaceae bacterium]
MSKQALIAAMNEQLSAEYQAIIQYIQYSAVVTGPHRPELVAFFRAEIPDEQTHAQYLADKIAALGGEPTTTAKPVPHSDDARQLLEYVLAAENQAIAAYTNLIKLADEAGEVGIRIQMENFVQDENNHRDETQKILSGKWD